MTDNISKPVRPADLIAMVDRYANGAVLSARNSADAPYAIRGTPLK
jgi:hypothetical protein